MARRIWLPGVVALSGAVTAACGGGGSAPAAQRPAATRAAVTAAVRDYRACGLDVLTTTAQGDCVAALLTGLAAYSYTATASSAELYREAQGAGAAFRGCWARAPRYDASACDGTEFYALLTQLSDVLPA